MDGAAQKGDKDVVADILREAQLLPAAQQAGVLNDEEFVRRVSEVLDEITLLQQTGQYSWFEAV